MNTNILTEVKTSYNKLPKNWQTAIYLSVYFVISIISWRLTNIASAYASQWIGASRFGDFAISLRVSHNLAHIFVMGQEATLLMFLAKYNNSHEKQSGLVRWVRKSLAIKSILMLAVVTCALVFDNYIKIQFIERYFLYGLLAIPFIVISGVYERFFLYLKQFFVAFLPRGIYQPIIFIILVYLLSQVTPPSPISALIAYVGSFIFTMVISIIYGLISGFRISPEYDQSDIFEWRVSGLFYTFSTLIIKSSPSFAFFYLEQLGPLESSVGLFAAITNLTYGFHLLTKPFDSYLKPSIATLYTQGDLQALQKEVNFVNKLRWSIILLLVVTLLMQGQSYLLDYGDIFINAYQPLMLLTLFMAIQYLGMPCHELLNYTNNQEQLSFIMAIQCALIVILAKFLIPTYDIWGAVIAQGIPCLLSTLASAYLLKKRTGIKAYFVF